MASALPPEVLERMRRGVPLVLSATGAFRWGDEPITHAGVNAALRAGLDVSDSGEPTVAIGPQWCYLRVEDTPLRVVTVEHGAAPGELQLRLDDDRTLVLDPATLWEEPELGLRCTVPAQGSGRPLAARFTNRAANELATWIDLEKDPPVLVVDGRTTPIRDRPST